MGWLKTGTLLNNAGHNLPHTDLPPSFWFVILLTQEYFDAPSLFVFHL